MIAAIQRMRARAQQNGRLTNTPQQLVNTQYQGGQSAITIQPAQPQTMYVPSTIRNTCGDSPRTAHIRRWLSSSVVGIQFRIVD